MYKKKEILQWKDMIKETEKNINSNSKQIELFEMSSKIFSDVGEKDIADCVMDLAKNTISRNAINYILIEVLKKKIKSIKKSK